MQTQELDTYNRKRDFARTPEPAGMPGKKGGNRYIIQKHAASRLHYDFRLQIGGVLKSWAVPKGPSLSPQDKRLAAETEDHPLPYADFEGIIPKGQYGGGTVMLWDTGTWEPNGDPEAMYKKGHLSFRLKGERLKGEWSLVRMPPRRKGDKNWLLIKKEDEFAEDEHGERLVEEETTSVITGRSMEKIARTADRVHGGPEFNIPAKAKKVKMPGYFGPQLATLVKETPEGESWLHEVKYDGYRILGYKNHGMVNFYSRRGKDWTHRFPKLKEIVAQLPVEQVILDGEMVVLGEDGVSSFQLLQQAFDAESDAAIVYFVFDLLYVNGHDLRPCTLEERKTLLHQLIVPASPDEHLQYSDHIEGRGPVAHEHSCQMKLEGIISKRRDKPYEAGKRSRYWLKSKCIRRQEFIICGYSEPTHKTRGVGSLLLGVYDGDRLIYTGRVGTGFGDEKGREIRSLLDSRVRKTPPYDKSVRLPADTKGAHWAKPEIVCEVEFTEWTEDNALRHPSFKGLREDKAPKEVRQETDIGGVPMTETPPAQKKAKPASKAEEGGSGRRVTISSPEKVLFPEAGVTKGELADYYEAVAEWMLPHIAGRPVSLIRCPSGHEKQCFFQRHAGKGTSKFIHEAKIRGEKEPYLMIDSLDGLMAAAQMGAIEIHPWGSTVEHAHVPDRLVFDLDPDEEVPWSAVIDAARGLRDRLAGVKLDSFVKTTGGKGLHVVVPIAPEQDWEVVKPFTKKVAEAMQADEPKKFISKSSKAARKGKIFVDYLRNGFTASAVAPYSARARSGAPVAVPLRWDELGSLESAGFYTINSLPRRLLRLKSDPWKDMFDMPQSLNAALKAYGIKS